MENNSTNMCIRVNKELKENADKLFKSLGINTSCAINMFLTQCVRKQAIPFTISLNGDDNDDREDK